QERESRIPDRIRNGQFEVSRHEADRSGPYPGAPRPAQPTAQHRPGIPAGCADICGYLLPRDSKPPGIDSRKSLSWRRRRSCNAAAELKRSMAVLARVFPRRILINSASIFAGEAIVRFAIFPMAVVIARRFGSAALGEYGYALALASVLLVLPDLGLH